MAKSDKYKNYDDEDDEDDFVGSQNKRTSFNMAIDTLERMGEILREIKNVYNNPEMLTTGEAQHYKTKFIRNFFINAVPLIDSKEVDGFKKRVFELQPININIIGKLGDGTTKFKGTRAKYSQEFEDKMDELLIDIQISLQNKGVFMPPAEESSLF